MKNKQFKDNIYEILKADDRLWNEDKTELNQTLLLDLVENIDEAIIELFLEDTSLRNKFFVKIKEVYVFKINDFRFFMEENKVYNSYTKYKNQIGLTDTKKFLKDSGDVVLNFPYKDCVLEGGQSSEEGLDSYFEYDESVTATDEKKGFKANSYNFKQSKRKEIFFNQVLARDEIDRLFDEKALVNWKRFNKDGAVDVGDIKRDDEGTINENLIIKGNNLLALHSLKKQFVGKVKLIYIDPPYNTGSDSFGYNDNFNHSTWLTFMKNRLEIAREFLSDDGVIFVQCDDNEQAYLKVLMDDIFNMGNFEVSIFIQVRFENKTLNEDNNYQKVIENIFAYSKNSFKPNKDVVPYKLDKFEFEIIELTEGTKEIIDNKEVIIFKQNEYRINKIEPNINGLKSTWATGSLVNQGGSAAEFFYLNLKQRKQKDGLKTLYKVMDMGTRGDGLGYRYITGPKQESADNGLFYTGVPLNMKISSTEAISEKTKPISNYWDFKDAFGNCRTQGDIGFNSGKKPEQLLKRIIEISTKKGDIVLDYHLGSGTTCAVAHKMGRQYIGIEQMDYIENISAKRLEKVIEGEQSGISKAVDWKGGGDFIYFELAPWNEKAKEEINRCKSFKALKSLFDTFYEKYFLNYNFKVKEFKEKVIHEKEFKALSLDEQKKMFLTMLDLNQMYVLKSEMEDKQFDIDKKYQKLTSEFYNDEK